MNCRLCNASGEEQTIKGDFVYGGQDHHKFWQCADCKIIYLWPPLSPEQESKFYKQEFEKYMANRSGVDTKKGWSSPQDHVRINQPELERRMVFFIFWGVFFLGCRIWDCAVGWWKNKRRAERKRGRA